MKAVRFEEDQGRWTSLGQGRRGVDLVMELRNLQYCPTFFTVKKKKSWPPHNLLGFFSGSAVENSPAMQEMQDTRVWSLGGEDPQEEGMAAHPSVLDWRIPWTEEPAGLQSIGSQRVKTHWSDLAHMHMICSQRVFPSLPFKDPSTLLEIK